MLGQFFVFGLGIAFHKMAPKAAEVTLKGVGKTINFTAQSALKLAAYTGQKLVSISEGYREETVIDVVPSPKRDPSKRFPETEG